jgi:preprotein translocase subunit SecG
VRRPEPTYGHRVGAKIAFSILLPVFIIAFSQREQSLASPRKDQVLYESVPWYSSLVNALVLLTGIFLVFLVLIQRGKGGGLAGAFGGPGGSSAFGSRAGDLFTRITIGLAAAWVLLILLHVKIVQWSRPEASQTAEITRSQ